MYVTIKTNSGRKMSLEVEKYQKIKEVKEELIRFIYQDIKIENMILIYSGKLLKDEITLEEYQIESGSALTIGLYSTGG
jgi:hypothetical protein